MNIRNVSSVLVELLLFKSVKLLVVDICNESMDSDDENLGKPQVGHIQTPSDHLKTSYIVSDRPLHLL